MKLTVQFHALKIVKIDNFGIKRPCFLWIISIASMFGILAPKSKTLLSGSPKSTRQLNMTNIDKENNSPYMKVISETLGEYVLVNKRPFS